MDEQACEGCQDEQEDQCAFLEPVCERDLFFLLILLNRNHPLPAPFFLLIMTKEDQHPCKCQSSIYDTCVACVQLPLLRCSFCS